MLLAGCGAGQEASVTDTGSVAPSRSTPAATNSPPAALPAGADIVVVVPAVDTYGPLVAEGTLWVRGIESGKLFRIDPESGEIATSTTDLGCCLAVGEGAVWAPAPEAGTLERIDPQTGMVTDTFELGGLTVRAAAGGGKVWVNSHRGGSVFEIDSVTGEVTSIEIGPTGPAGPQEVYYVDGDVWVGVPNLGPSIVRIDPTTGEVVATIDVPGAGCHTMAATDRYMWLAGGCFDSPSQYDTVWKIDLRANQVASEFQPGGTFSQWGEIGYTDGSLWMLTTSGLLRIDPESDEVVVVSADVVGPGSISAEEHRLWVLTGKVVRSEGGNLGRELLRIPIP